MTPATHQTGDPSAFFDRQTGELTAKHLDAFVEQEVSRVSEGKQTPYMKMPLTQPKFIVAQFPNELVLSHAEWPGGSGPFTHGRILLRGWRLWSLRLRLDEERITRMGAALSNREPVHHVTSLIGDAT